MLYADGIGTQVGSALRKLVAIRSELPPSLLPEMKHLVTDPRVAVIVTREYKPVTKSIFGNSYVGVNRRYARTNQVIHVPHGIPDGMPLDVLVAHELVHAIGGTELDSEVVEDLLCRRFGGTPIITDREKREFWREPEGTYFRLQRKEGHLWWRNHKLWRRP